MNYSSENVYTRQASWNVLYISSMIFSREKFLFRYCMILRTLVRKYRRRFRCPRSKPNYINMLFEFNANLKMLFLLNNNILISIVVTFPPFALLAMQLFYINYFSDSLCWIPCRVLELLIYERITFEGSITLWHKPSPRFFGKYLSSSTRIFYTLSIGKHQQICMISLLNKKKTKNHIKKGAHKLPSPKVLVIRALELLKRNMEHIALRYTQKP